MAPKPAELHLVISPDKRSGNQLNRQNMKKVLFKQDEENNFFKFVYGSVGCENIVLTPPKNIKARN